MSTTFHEDLSRLQKSHDGLDGEVRLFHDGSIWMQTITASGETGWFTVATSVPKASVLIGRHFRSTRKDQRFLRVANLREAITIRDKIVGYLVDMRVRREIDNDSKSQPTDNRDSFPKTI
jgi:hypothetical protein